MKYRIGNVCTRELTDFQIKGMSEIEAEACGLSSCHCWVPVWPFAETPVACTRNGYQLHACSHETANLSGLDLVDQRLRNRQAESDIYHCQVKYFEQKQYDYQVS